MKASRPPLPDQAERDRFRNELARNFSVIAPAGVGKTTSIVERVLAVAEADSTRLDDPLLPRLVVVTYTRKAADEMLTRVRQRLDEARPHAQVHTHLAQAFFGTIHSFCQRLLVLAGPLCGFPGEAAVATDTERLWRQFLLDEADPLPSMPEDFRRAFSIHGRWSDVFTLARQWPTDPLSHLFPMPGRPPVIDPGEILSIKGTGNGKANIEASQANLRAWQEQLDAQGEASDPLPCPEPERVGTAREFAVVWREVFGPLRQWRRDASAWLAASVAESFAKYRRRTAQLTFDDLVQLAARLLRQPEARDLLRARGWRIILDEAQDTDPTQFVVLSELTRKPGDDGIWIDGASPGPRDGHFCMVGDPQQSIYSDRADLSRYLAIHRRLLADGGEEATFSVTMRCPVAAVEALNELFPRVLKRSAPGGGQVAYVPLKNPPAAAAGQVVCMKLPPPPDDLPRKAPVRISAYARTFADWWAQRTLDELRATRWNEVAILCPRNDWLERIGAALQARNIPVQLLSRRGKKADDPVYAWFTAVLVSFAHPRDAFEIYGLLRDVFGHSDDELVTFIRPQFVRKRTHPLRIDLPPAETSSPVGASLQGLHDIWRTVRELPLLDAVDYLVEGLEFAGRLEAAGVVDRCRAEATLRLLRHETAAAEADRHTFVSWAEALRRALGETQEESAPSGNAVVLLTAHKAKGLGFQTVVIPAFFRRFLSRSESYPRCTFSGTGPPRILFDKLDRDDEEAEREKQRKREEAERLLYVALTRVKQSLVLLADEAWWQPLRMVGDSFGGLLQVEENAPGWPAWKALPQALAAREDESETASLQGDKEAPIAPRGQPDRTMPPPAPPKFWKHITPSSLQRHEPASQPARSEPEQALFPVFSGEIRPVMRADPAAYGNWWHDLMETAPWSCGDDAVRLHLFNRLPECPDPGRGLHELELFAAGEVARRLCAPEWEVHVELPFLSGNVPEKIGYEGYIDLLARHLREGHWMMIDWKTDRLAGEAPETTLLHTYGPQIAVYRDVLTTSLGRRGESGIYSTVSGKWIPLDG